MTKRLRNLSWLLFVLCLPLGTLLAQQRTISGVVLDGADESPVIGATILVVGAGTGTVTDADGKFSVTVQKGQVLRFSYTGFATQEINVDDLTSNLVNITMQSAAAELGEVVVTALGIKEEKRRLSYSVQELKGDEISGTGRDNFLVSLQGRVAGLNMTPTSGQAGSSVVIQLRGPSSIDGNNQPLFVVDGLPVDNRTFNQGALVSDQPNRTSDYQNRIGDINPADIESITILKGPEAAALYGIDASSGAIIITTKRGKDTGGRGKVNYDNLFRTEQVFRLPQYNTDYQRGFNGAVDPTSASLRYFGPKLAEGVQKFDNVDNFFRNGFTQTHNLGIEGGNKSVSYRLSTSYTDQDGFVPTNEFNRLSIRLNSTAKISKKFEANTTLNYINTSSTVPFRGQNGYLLGLLQWPSTDDAANYLNADGTRRRLVQDATEPDNPFWSVFQNTNENRTKRTIGNVSLNYTPNKWLTLTGRMGGDIYNTLGMQFLHPESNLGITGRGRIETFSESSQLLNGNVLATVRKKVGQNFSTNLTIGGSVDDRNYETTAVSGERLYIPDFRSINNSDPTSQRNKLTVTRQRLLSVLGSFEFGYKNLAFLSVRGRNDWSSTLPIENRSFFYPSVGLSFVFSELKLFKESFLSYGKLRATYSQTGKDAPPYRILPRLVPQTTTGGGFLYDFFGGNPALKPERTEGYEYGVDLMFFKRRLGVDFTYFSNSRFDQIVAQRLSYGTGFIFGLVNGGTFSNKGIEISLKGSPIQSKKVTWDIIANFSQFTTSVDNLPADQPEFYNSDTWLYSNARASAFVADLARFYPGMNLNFNQRGLGTATAIGGYSYLRNSKGDVLINPTSGLPVINTNFLPIGDRNPDFTLGITNQVWVGGFSASFLLDLRKGGDVFNGTERFLFQNGLSARTTNRDIPTVFNGVLRDGRENSENPTVNTIQVSPLTRSDFFTAFPESEFVEKDINWIRLRDVSLAYTFPASTFSKSKFITSLNVFLTGTDLWLMTNYTGADPNVNGNSATTRGVGAAGFDFGTISLPRTISGGIRVGL
jgi:TonB-linked SusC/RagA family outer membrane protein